MRTEKLPRAAVLAASGTNYHQSSPKMRFINKPHCLNYILSGRLYIVAKSLLIFSIGV